jgi:hypothetical protein
MVKLPLEYKIIGKMPGKKNEFKNYFGAFIVHYAKLYNVTKQNIKGILDGKRKIVGEHGRLRNINA